MVEESPSSVPVPPMPHWQNLCRTLLTPTSAAAWKVPSPRPNRIDTGLAPALAVARSGRPSPLKPPMATETGDSPTLKSRLAMNDTSRWAHTASAPTRLVSTNMPRLHSPRLTYIALIFTPPSQKNWSRTSRQITPSIDRRDAASHCGRSVSVAQPLPRELVSPTTQGMPLESALRQRTGGASHHSLRPPRQERDTGSWTCVLALGGTARPRQGAPWRGTPTVDEDGSPMQRNPSPRALPFQRRPAMARRRITLLPPRPPP